MCQISLIFLLQHNFQAGHETHAFTYEPAPGIAKQYSPGVWRIFSIHPAPNFACSLTGSTPISPFRDDDLNPKSKNTCHIQFGAV
jgi:hypothetical protein